MGGARRWGSTADRTPPPSEEDPLSELDVLPAETRWPAHLHPGALRWLRSSTNYDDVAFYRNLVDLPVGGSFQESLGKEGTTVRALTRRLPWVCIAPLDRPVVPDV